MATRHVMLAVVAAAVVGVALSQNTTGDDQGPPPDMSQGPGVGGSMGPIGGVQAQQAIMGALSGVVLEFQSANAWYTYVSYMVQKEHVSDDDDGTDLEEEDDEDDEESGRHLSHHNLEMFPPNAYSYYGASGGSPQVAARTKRAVREFEERMYPGLSGGDLVELKSEEALSYCLKLMWLQAAKGLETAQQKHFQNKITVAMLASSGLTQNPYMSSVLMLMYYRSVLDTMASALAIAFQDTWTAWNHYEMVETVNFKGSASMPGEFENAMNNLEVAAFHSWNTVTSLDIQSLMIDMYLNAMVSQIAGSMAGPAPAAASASFLEEGVEAEPAEPSQQSGSMGPQMAYYWSYMLQMMTLYSRFIASQSSQSLFTASYLTHGPGQDAEFEHREEYVAHLHKSGIMALAQWAQIKQILAYYNMFFAWYGTGGFGSMAGGSSGSLGAALGGSFGGPSGSMLGGAVGSSLGGGSFFQQDAQAQQS